MSPAVLQALEKNDDGCCQFALLWLVEKREVHHCAQRSMDTDIAGAGYKRDLTRRADSRFPPVVRPPFQTSFIKQQ